MWDLFGPEIEPVPRAYGIFLDQRLNPGLLYWQAGKPDTYTGRIVLNKYLITLQFKFLDCSLICSENPQVALLVRIYTLPWLFIWGRGSVYVFFSCVKHCLDWDREGKNKKQQWSFGWLQSTCLAENTGRRNQRRRDRPFNLWVQTAVPPRRRRCVNKSNSLSVWKFSIGTHIHLLLFPQNIRTVHASIRSCSFRSHSLGKRGGPCKLAFSMKQDKGRGRGSVECWACEGR